MDQRTRRGNPPFFLFLCAFFLYVLKNRWRKPNSKRRKTMENLVVLGILIIVMEAAVEGIKNQLAAFPVWETIKGKIIPFTTLVCMTGLIVGTGITLLASINISCDIRVDYVATILITSLGTQFWHEFKKKLSNAKEEE